MQFEIAFVMLFAVATAVALVTRWLKIPYTVALVLAGLVLGATHAFTPPRLTKELLYAVFLPGLLFEAAFHLEFRRFWQNKLAIVALAVPGVVAAIALTGLALPPAANALDFVQGFSLVHGLVFAALIAATDPIAVVSLFRTLGAPKRLGVIVEGESLLNDGTAVVLFTLILRMVDGGGTTVGGAALSFVTVVGMGLLIGATMGLAVSKVIQRVDDAMIEITLTTIAAYGSFVAAEHFHYSGVIATVTAGMLCGNYAARTGMSPSTRVAAETFWEYVAFALNSMVFLLIGFEVKIAQLLAAYRPILLAWMVVTLGRAAVVASISLLLGRTRERLPWSWSAALTWGGLRGGLSMVLVLALPTEFPHRELLVTMTFGVVLVSIVVQGLTMAPLLRRLGLTGSREDREAYETHRAELRAVAGALAALERMAVEKSAHADLLTELREEYQQRARAAEVRIRQLHFAQATLLREEMHAARRQLLLAEKEQLLDSHVHGLIGREAFDKLLANVDARLVALEEGDIPEPPADSRPAPPRSGGDGARPGPPADD